MRRTHGFVLAAAMLAAPALGFAADAQKKEVVADVVPIITLAGEVKEQKTPLSIFSPETQTLRSLIATVEKAAADEKVAALIVKVESPSWGIAQLSEFHTALKKFRESGKPLYVTYDSSGLGGYVLSTAATEVVLPPVGGLELLGMHITMMYFKGLLAKIGVQAEVVNTGKFKNAFEPFTHDSMSEGTRIQMQALMDDIFAELKKTVAENRKVSEEKAQEILTMGPYTSNKALEAKAIDRIAYFDELQDSIEKNAGRELEFDTEYSASPKGEGESFNLMTLLSGMGKKDEEEKDGKPKIALVYAVGGISDGRAEKNPFGSQEGIYSDDFVDLIDDVMDEGGVKALVLRVDSPGGSAIASDKMWHRLQQVQASGVPIIVSMGNVAASGGYYISMGADKIVADPTTITGSIGVIGGKFALGGTYEKLGITRDTLAIGDRYTLYDEANPWSERDRKLLDETIEDVYNTFTSKVAKGRGMTQDKVKELGGGRVWTGTSAKANGLVDELGGLEDAIAIARKIGKAPDAELVEFPKEKNFFEALEELMGGAKVSMHAASITSNPLFQSAALVVPEKHLLHLAFMVDAMKDKPTAMVMMPWAFDIK